jgi:hypothetical protein
MNRRTLLFSGALAVSALSVAGCGGGASVVSALAGGGSATVTGVDSPVIVIPAMADPGEFTYLSTRKFAYRVRLVMRGTGFKNGTVPTPAGNLSRYAVYLDDSFITQTDISISGDQLTADVVIPVEFTQGDELNRQRRLVVYDRLNQRNVSFSPESASVVRVAFGT